MAESIALRELISGKSVYLDCWEGTASFRSLVPRSFLDPGAFESQAEILDSAIYDRKNLAAALRDQNIGFGAAAASLEKIAGLEDPRSLVVIGGQQAGLFGGPLYTLYKALTVLSLSQRLEALLHRRVIPMFWIASEDSDLAEVNHASMTDAAGRMKRFELGGHAGENVPVSRIRLGPGIMEILALLSRELPDAEHAGETLAALTRAYSPNAFYHRAFGSWMQYCLGERGLVMVDPSDVRLKSMAVELFRREIEGNGVVARAVIRQNGILESAGYKPQVAIRDGILTLFFQDPARESIAAAENGFELKNGARKFTKKELTSLLAEQPELFSPNAALRPLFQDAIFPTLAVVLGPSELAYHTQLTAAYRDMGVVMPILFPRASLTLIDGKAGKLLDAYGLGLSDVLTGNGKLANRLAARDIPPSLIVNYAAGRAAVEKIWSGLITETEAFDPTLGPTARNAQAFGMKRFEWMEKKILRAARRKNDVLLDRVERINTFLYPNGGLQERTLVSAQFLARHGKSFMEAAFRAIDPFAPEHRGVRLPV